MTIPSPSSDSTTTPIEHELLIDEDPPQAMLVRVGDARLALPVEQVREVLRARQITPVPGTPAWVTGLVAVRGTLVPVADLAMRAGGAAASWLLVVERGGRAAALGVTAVDGVHNVDGELPECGVVRLQASEAADVLDVGALFRELFEGD